MKNIIKDLKSLITVMITVALIVAMFMKMIEPKDFFAIALMVFTYYFTRKTDNTPHI